MVFVTYLNINKMFNEDSVVVGIQGSKKRTILPNELFGKFSSKNDFIRYFRDNLQLYLPPEYMM